MLTQVSLTQDLDPIYKHQALFSMKGKIQKHRQQNQMDLRFYVPQKNLFGFAASQYLYFVDFVYFVAEIVAEEVAAAVEIVVEEIVTVVETVVLAEHK